MVLMNLRESIMANFLFIQGGEFGARWRATLPSTGETEASTISGDKRNEEHSHRESEVFWTMNVSGSLPPISHLHMLLTLVGIPRNKISIRMYTEYDEEMHVLC